MPCLLAKCTTHDDCFANKGGHCTALRPEGFSDVACKFYKSKQQLEDERRGTYERLSSVGRKDLVEKYGV